MKIAVIGGGISGLATAFYLKRFSPTNDITIFETESEFGGKLKTVDKFGFRVELTSGIFFENNLYLNEFIRDAGLSHHIARAEEQSKIKLFFDNNALQQIPSSTGELLKTNALGTFSKLSVICGLLKPRKKASDSESLHAYLSNRIGKGAAALLGDLMATAFFASTPEKLSAKASFSWLCDTEQSKSKTLGRIFEEISSIKEVPLLFKNGASAFIKELSGVFAFNKKTGCEVARIKKLGSKWLVETTDNLSEEFDRVVLCAPSFASSRIVKEEDEQLSELLKSIEYSPLAVVSLGYESLPHSMDGLGIVSTRRSNAQALAIVWDSSISKDSAPDGKKLLRVIIGGQRHPFLALKQEDELLNIATGAISEMMGVYEEPMINHITRWHKAVPNYDIGHAKLVDEIFGRAAEIKGLYLNSSAFEGVSLEECVKNSKETALKIISE